MKLMMILTFALTIAGCTTLPGGVKVSKSEYDGTNHIYMTPGWANFTNGGSVLNNSSVLCLGARRNSLMPADEAILIVRNHVIKHFDSSTPNFFVNIDGEETKLSPIKNNTDCEVIRSGGSYCEQEYLVKVSFIEKMVTAKDVRFKLNLRDSYTTGGLAGTGMSTAKPGLIKFLEQVRMQNAELRTPTAVK